MVRPPTMLDQPAPHRSESGPPLKQRRHSASENAGLEPYPCKGIISEIFAACQGRPPVDMENYLFKDNGEDPKADLDKFFSYETLPRRVAWSSIKRKDYDRVKRVFEQDGVSICKGTCDADIIKFKEALLLAAEDMF